MIRAALPLRLSLAALLFGMGAAASADMTDVWIRSGFLEGQYQGKNLSSGTFHTDVNLEAEFWLYQKPTQALAFRLLVANESDLGRTRFLGAGAGQRYFIFSDGRVVEQETAAGFVEIRPRWAPFIGWDVDAGQFLVLPVGDVLSAYATMLDVDASLGARYFFSKTFSMDALAGYTYGTSITSSVNATMTMIRVFLGVGLSF
jgi:hypothetical protein